MKVNKTRNSIMLAITALIWGIAFVAQSEGGDAVGPYSFNCVRSLIGGMVLLPVIGFMDKKKRNSEKKAIKQNKRTLYIGGTACGVVLFLASSFQQVGMYLGTSAGKAGFLTACYILLVPLIGLFMGKRCGWNIWIGVLLTLTGLYLLCMKGSFSLQLSDGLMLISALMFAFHILVVDYFSPKADGVRMSCIQFIVCGLLSVIPMIFSDIRHSAGGLDAWLGAFQSFDAWIPILYAGIMSCGVAYTFQIIGQNGLNPTVASLIMSLESVFSVLAGWLILDQSLSQKEIMGCVLIFTAIIFAQIPMKQRRVENYVDI